MTASQLLKHRAVLSFIAMVLAASCSAPEDQETAAATSANEPDSAVEAEDPGAWFKSEARPVNRACNEPDYRPGQPDTYPALHSHLYPVIQERQQAMLAKVKALAPQVTDKDTYALEEDLRLRREINILNQLVFLGGQDLAPRYLLTACTIQTYRDDQCGMMQRMLQSTVKLENFEFDGEALSFEAQLLADGSKSSMRIANADLDGLQLRRQSATKGSYTGEWLRTADGTETFSANSPDGKFSYTELPDCSGSAQAVRTDDGGHPWELSWRWTSVREPKTFTVQYSECKVNGLNERECINGSL